MKRITLIILSYWTLLTTAQAASFDCEKATNHVERLICTDDELSKLDERMAGLYETALLDKNIAGTVKQTQKQWLKERNSCSDAACVKSAYMTRMREIFPDNKARAVLPPRKFQASLDSKDWVTIFMNSKIGEEKAEALLNINRQDRPDRQKYNEIGLHDLSPKVRETAAYFYQTDLDKLTPILFNIITSDPDPQVRSSAAGNLACQFSCNGADYGAKDIEALERQLPLLKHAFRDEYTGQAMVEMLDSVWCDLSKDSQKLVTETFGSNLTIKVKHGDEEEWDNNNVDIQAKNVLNKHLNKPCSLRTP